MRNRIGNGNLIAYWDQSRNIATEQALSPPRTSPPCTSVQQAWLLLITLSM